MATVKKDYIFKVMEEQQCPYWRITDGMGKFIGENDSEAEVDKAMELLKECIDFIDDSKVNVMLSNRTKSEKAKGGRGYKQHEFAVRMNPEGSNSFGGGGINGTIITLLKELNDSQRKVELQQKEFEMKELRREFDELKKDKDKSSIGERGLDMLAQYFKLSKPAASIAGVNDGAVKDDDITKQRKTKEALKRLAQVDPNLPDSLLIIAKLAEKNKEQYFSSIKTIKDAIDSGML